MTVLTAFEISNNYPDQIMISAAKGKNNLWALFMYRLKGEDIHKLMLSSECVFESEEKAVECGHEQCKLAIDYVKNLKPKP